MFSYRNLLSLKEIIKKICVEFRSFVLLVFYFILFTYNALYALYKSTNHSDIIQYYIKQITMQYNVC